MKDLQSYFDQQLKDRRSRVTRWVVGLSGGLDSVVLLHLAARSVPAEQLLVVNIDHQLQSQSAQWSDFCGRLAGSLKLSFVSHKVVVDEGSSLEQAARNARYQLFGQLLEPGDCLLLAHHLDDQAETMLFRLLRGAGVRGLAGMPDSRRLGQAELYRPLLNITRQELHSWAQAQQLQWIDDPSNNDLSYDRNYLRHKVLPLLQTRWPGFSRRWADTAGYLRDAEQLHRDLAEIDLHSVGSGEGLECQALLDLSRSRRANLLRFWCLRAGVSIGERQIQSVMQLIAAAHDRQPVVQLGAFQVRRYQGDIVLQPEQADIDWGNRSLSEESVQTSQGVLQVVRSQAPGGLKSLTGVTLRNRSDGDRCRPVGRGGSCSLKKLFQEHHIPAWQRSSWPVCVVDDEIVALPGICICEGWQSEKKGSGFALKWLPTALSARGDSDTL
ncbi:tRNA lysidine(34) synthetase TilS [Amphritea pacifica]|uniref:tRNA(Ile)-lysidine synthase n=1 Tax=Amphritea pacifica TaxID=2811233 RepID=A0ABS2W691_9GAMM|nr:tRNA lysidine(34) synthetase TilS [Amphritea pacifica]MBN0987027.1 tRNA lysidine(34) synthetase TilS [Amphritea pacifica]